MNEKKISVIGFGNPILDVNICENTSFLIDKYDLKLNTQNDLPAKKFNALREEIQTDTYKKVYTPGGCVLNTVRVFQWLENQIFKTIVHGSIGSDEHGRYLTEILHKEGVITKFHVINEDTTSAILLAHDKYRTIIYTSEDMKACTKFSQASVHYLEAALENISDSKILVFDGFFTFHCESYIYRLLEQCQKYDTLVAFSAGGETIIKARNAKKTYLPFILQSQIVNLNLQEFQAVCELVQINHTNIKLALQAFCELSNNMVKSTLCEYSRIIVVTDGENPVHCYTIEDGYVVFPIQALAVNQIKDTTGAGDAFMAGFLYGICYRKSIVQSLQMAYQAALEIIQQVGCHIPARPHF